ncbi:MAG: DUF92 domain-containing protein [Candidatus Thermoplasmatota archaeon]|jgi:uncharacterized protein (TIGR00297 family)|nr:DUF92 domain-containing protein [Candidatus Thermoplasmatota archaeon]MCL5987717.1 DUF92 domain-containing protein [Candidatus Thermoplasmatota archaeon]
MHPFPSLQYTIIAIAVLAVLFLLSYYLKILDLKGTIAAIIFGAVVVFMDSFSWLILLLIFLATSHFATKYRFEYKKSLETEEGTDGERHFSNVFYAGIIGLFIAVLNFFYTSQYDLFLLFAAAFSSIAADTLGSELGVLDPNTYLITTFKRVKTGINGGISFLGEIATLFGAIIIGISYVFLTQATGIMMGFVGVVVAGFAAAQVDSVLGATLENRNIIDKGHVNFLASLSAVIIALPFLLLS